MNVNLSLARAKELKKDRVRFPVLYDPANPEEAHPLITREDFDYYGIEIPDSIDWIKGFIGFQKERVVGFGICHLCKSPNRNAKKGVRMRCLDSP